MSPQMTGIVFAALAFSTLACQGREAGPGDTSSVPIVTSDASPITGKDPDTNLQHVVNGEAFWSATYQSLPDLIRIEGTIVIGRVDAVLLPFDPRPGYLGQATPEPLPSDDPKYYTPSAEELSRPPGRGFSVYSVELLSVAAGDSLQVADTIAIMQPSGVFEGIAYETNGDPVIEVGLTYLFFLEPQLGLREISFPEPWGTTYSGAPFGRFLVDPTGVLKVIDPRWDCVSCAVSRALAGKTVQGALAVIDDTPPGAALPTLAPVSTLVPVPADPSTP